MQSLVKIEFFQNGIFAEGFIELLKALKFNKNLKHVKLNDNIIKSSIKHLIESLEELKDLEELDISDSLIGAKNCVKLFEALKVNFKIN
jgi:Ran GTPase-activating protein (RanGAP) involved in mRNA processing and transport